MTRHDLSNDELRRELRALGASSTRDARALSNSLEVLFTSDASTAQRTEALLGRRRLLQIGGFGVTTAALMAACGGTDSPGVAKIGNAPSTTELPAGAVNDVVLLRTASSLEHSVISLYDLVVSSPDLIDAAYVEVAKRFRDDHAAHAAAVEELTAAAGGEPWTCGNPRIDELLVPAILRAIQGAEATATTPALAPSDDPKRDVLNVAQSLESLAGSTYQALVPALSLPSLRKAAMGIAAQEVRHAAILAIAITGRPQGYVTPDEIAAAGGVAPELAVTEVTVAGGAPATPIPVAFAVPSQFGYLGATPLVIGSPSEIGTRVTINLETPSLNSLVYEYLTPEC